MNAPWLKSQAVRALIVIAALGLIAFAEAVGWLTMRCADLCS